MMFSPEPAAEAASLRHNPRRRRRNDADSTSQRQPRKRSRLASDSFNATVNGQAAPVRLNGVSTIDAKALNGTAANGHLSDELTFRDKREVNGDSHRQVRDTSTILTRNPKFTVQSQPALPEKLKRNSNSALRGFLHPRQTSTFAVAVTHESVSIWDSSSPTSSPSTRVLSLPYPVKSQDQLPLACLVSNARKELGLILVYPTTGKITFWEDVDSAESLKLFEQRRYGVEGSLKLLNHEVVEEIIDAESAGLVLLTSSGRLIHLTLQDSYGHAQIGITIFQHPSKSSFLGGLTQVFSSSWKNRLNSVKLRHISKGRVEVVALSGDGIFKIWEVREAAQHDHIGDIHSEADVREALIQASLLDSTGKNNLKFLNIAIHAQGSSEVVHHGDQTSAPIDVYVLVQFNTAAKSQYVLLDVRLGEARANVMRIFPIRVFEPALNSEVRTQLLLTDPGHTALIIDERSAIVVSIPARKASTDRQEDGREAAEIPSFYQDIISLDDARGAQFIAASAEPCLRSSKHQKRLDASVICFVKPARILKLTISNYNDKGASARFRLPTAQNKIEQAIFFGSASENILNLYDLAAFSYTGTDVESAALSISASIVTTSSENLQQSAASMEQHIVLRIKALQDLATFLQKYCPQLSRSARWRLLSDAERLAAARALWQSHDRRIQDENRRHVALLEEAIDTALERYKDENSEADKTDDVRLFFIKKLNMLEKLLPLCFGIIKERHKSGALNTTEFLRLAPEMNEIIVTVLGTAYQYRQRQASQYGLSDENLEDGLLTVGFEDLDRFWTSSDDVIKTMGWSIKLTHDLVSTIIGSGAEGPHIQDAEAISETMEAVIRISCRAHTEAYRWLTSQSDEVTKQKGLEMKTAFESQVRRNHICYLYDMGQVQRGLVLAEDLEDIPSLVDLALRELDFQKGVQQRSTISKSSKQRGTVSGLETIEEQIRHFFRKFGQKFAELFYANQVASHRLADLIDKDLGNKELRTQFLRSDSGYSKVSWINEVLNEDNLLRASKNLTGVAHSRESNAWSKKVELSISKLALLALPATGGEDQGDGNAEQIDSSITQWNDAELDILDIQQRLDATVRPATVDALDEEAKLSNVMISFGHGFTKTHPSLTQLLKLGFSDLISQRVMGVESLIDVLTLINLPAQTDGEESSAGIGEDQYYLALKVLRAAGSAHNLAAVTAELLKKLIWKRCIVSQDWNDFGRTADLSDSEVQDALRETAVFHTIKHGVKEGFFSAPLDAEIPLPSTLVGAGSNPDDFVMRFPSEDLRGPIAIDNARDDQTLNQYLEHAHLDDIWSTIKELAISAQEEDAQVEADKRLRFEEFVAQKDEEEALEYEGDDEEVEDGVAEDYIKEEDVDENDVVQGIENVDDAAETESAEVDGDVDMNT